VTGKREEEHKAEDGGWYRSERTFGSFYRRVPLPAAIKPQDVSARFNNGVLEVSVPLPPEMKDSGPTKIPVQ
jgi:HSP20 family protein